MKYMSLLFVALIGLSACNTIEGVGKDVSSAARGVKEVLPNSTSGSSSNYSGDNSSYSSGAVSNY